MDYDAFFEYVKLSSIPLRKLDNNSMPIGLASGCLIDYKKRRILLTVQHATGDMGKWAAEIKYEHGKGTLLYPLVSMNFFGSFSINNPRVKDIDFSFVTVPNTFTSYFQEIKPNGKILSEIPRNICQLSFDSEPDSTKLYGFSGQVLPDLVSNQLITKHRVYMGLKYIGTDNDYYIFELPISHPGHEHFKGCSGSPIIDNKGNTIALVCGGESNTNRIFGISIKKYQVAIDITCGDLARDT
ncbi:MAG: hypothetical protein JXB26_19860 [Candidatus Aminicenantes bacterium]|nr:hypothetical protein [Candidatus Aminicenantes bacterium]